MRWKKSALGRSLKVLPRSDQRKIIVIVIIQIFLGILDLLGVATIGLLGSLSVSNLQSQIPKRQVDSVLNFLNISGISFQDQALILGLVAVSLLMGRTILSIYFTRRVIFFLTRRGAMVSSNLISRLLSQPILTLQLRSEQELLFSVTTGVSIITIYILATSIILVADFSLLLLMSIGLFVIDPITATGTLTFFVIIAYLLYRLMYMKAGILGAENSRMNIKSNEKIIEVLASYRESIVRNRRAFYGREIQKSRYALANNSGKLTFMPHVSKYVIESSVVLGSLLIAAIQFHLHDATQAVTTLAVFLAAGTRVTPSVLRIQQGALTIRSNLGQAKSTLELIEMLGNRVIDEEVDDALDLTHQGFIPKLEAKNVSVTYPNRDLPAISSMSFTIPAGASVGVVGPSGSGKSTLIDVLLGVMEPDQGSILISGLPPLLAAKKWPGAISYVPQNGLITSGTIRENVSLGYSQSVATDDLIIQCLKQANLDSFVAELPHGLDTQVGEYGTKLSGGQRQRLRIARAMFTRPQLLVLDESTSSLDGETEAVVTESIKSLHGSATLVVIAHRLSTVKDADIVIYLSEGMIKAMGTFEEVRKEVLAFDNEARRVGL